MTGMMTCLVAWLLSCQFGLQDLPFRVCLHAPVGLQHAVKFHSSCVLTIRLQHSKACDMASCHMSPMMMCNVGSQCHIQGSTGRRHLEGKVRSVDGMFREGSSP